MVVQYGVSGFPDKSAGAKINGGANFFGGGDSTEQSSASQTVDVSQAATEIDAGQVSAELAADLGGFQSQDDNATVSATFIDSGGGALGTLKIGPVTEAQRNATTELLPRSGEGYVPKGTRSIKVTMSARRYAGSWDDGYIDNVDLQLARATPLHPSLGVRCSGKRVLRAAITPAKGIKSVVFSVRSLRKKDSKAPYSVQFALGKLPRHPKVKAVVVPAAGAPITLTKRAPC